MSFFSKLFGGYKDPSKAAMPYYSQIPGQTAQYQQPYFNAGTQALPQLQNQYQGALDNPGGKVNEIGQNYQQSPGFQFALQQALGAGDHAAAAGGMAGSPEHQQRSMQMATDIGNQDYNNWMNHALGMYGQGLSGEQNLAGMGQSSGNNMADMISNSLSQQGQLAYTGQQNRNQQRGSTWNNILSGAGALAAFTPWGQTGGAFDTAMNRLGGR